MTQTPATTLEDAPWGRTLRVQHPEGEHAIITELPERLSRRQIRAISARLRAISALQHPAILAPDAIVTTESRATLHLPTQAYGEPITCPARSWVAAAAITADVAEALAHLHQAGHHHGALAPGAVRITSEGSIRLAGLEREPVLSALDTPLAGDDALRAGPERRSGQPASLRADLYGLGALLTELLTGRPPRPGEDDALGHLDARLRAQLPPALETLLLRLLSADPAQRPESAQAVRIELEAIIHGERRREEPLAAYIAQLVTFSQRKERALSPEERAEIAAELGLSHADIEAAEEAACDHVQRGLGYARHALWDDAISELRDAAALLPDDLEATFALAQAHHQRFVNHARREDLKESTRLCRRCIELDAHHEPAFALLSELSALDPPTLAEEHPPARRRRTPRWSQVAALGGASFLLVLTGLLMWNPAAPTQPLSDPAPLEPPALSPSPQPESTVLEVSPPTLDARAFTAPDGATMVVIPEGDALLGHPAARSHLERYAIDATEITVSAYQACLEAGACAPEHVTAHSAEDPLCNLGRPGAEGHPMNCISLEGARDFTRWRSARDPAHDYRLPTPEEWERAARGSDARAFPWGEQGPDCSAARIGGCDAARTAPAGAHPADRSPLGVFDMAGNLAEWTHAGSSGFVMGASFLQRRPRPLHVRGSAPTPLGPEGHHAYDVGFRTVATW